MKEMCLAVVVKETVRGLAAEVKRVQVMAMVEEAALCLQQSPRQLHRKWYHHLSHQHRLRQGSVYRQLVLAR